jgi:NitT/TauT family transport system substrate-binding protein
LCAQGFALVSVSRGDDSTLEKVTLLPHWIPQAQFAGYMIALEKGFFRDAGIRLELMKGGPQTPPFDFLANRKTDFCTGWLSTAVRHRVRGIPVVNVGQFFQRSSLMLVTRKALGVKSPEDLSNRRIGLWEGDFRIPALALFRKFGLRPVIVPLYETVNLFHANAVDAVSVMEYNEYHLLLNSGLNADELNVLRLRDYGMNFPEDGLYCLESFQRERPDLCARMLEACVKGWRYALDHPDETLKCVMRHANEAHTGTNLAHQRWMLAKIKEIMPENDNAGEMGRLRRDDYENVCATLKESGVISLIPNYADFHKGPR